MALESLDLANGILVIIFCSISIYVGIRIMSKYFKYRQTDLLFVGFTWIALSSPWYPASISFILVFILNIKPLGPQAYFFIGNIMVPFGAVAWIISFLDLFKVQKRKLIIFLYAIANAIYLIIFLYFLMTDFSVIGELRGKTDVSYHEIASIYLIATVLIFFITGLLFARASLKSDKPDIRLKGKLLIVAFVSITIGTSLDALLPLSFITLPIFRSLEILASIFFYFGYLKKIEETEELEKEILEDRANIEEFLKIVSKHKRRTLTEEEILYHKEKRICLVCKGKISRRKKYICPKCDILYCLRCSVALSSLENICWVCETPIDPSKPVKISETTEELEIKMSKTQKKPKTKK